MMGSTKQGEYMRSAEHFTNIALEKGLYLALTMLYDSQYNNEDIKEILKYMEKDKRNLKPLSMV